MLRKRRQTTKVGAWLFLLLSRTMAGVPSADVRRLTHLLDGTSGSDNAVVGVSSLMFSWLLVIVVLTVMMVFSNCMRDS